MDDAGTYNKGEAVPHTGEYVCAPCGFKRRFATGESFPECTSCLSGTPEGHEEYAEGLELWEKVRDLPDTSREEKH